MATECLSTSNHARVESTVRRDVASVVRTLKSSVDGEATFISLPRTGDEAPEEVIRVAWANKDGSDQ